MSGTTAQTVPPSGADARPALLCGAGWAGAPATGLAGDASARSYLRLTRAPGDTAILMQAPVQDPQDRASLSAFLDLGRHLAGLGLSTPAVIAAEADHGLVLMEDFGDATLSRLLAAHPATARTAYRATATEVLPTLAKAPVPPGLARPDPAGQAEMIRLTLDLLPDPAAVAGLPAALAVALAAICPGPPVLSLRDCHGDNLIWLPGRAGAARIGLLDYQDAVALPLGYDLASLIDDPRRELPADWRAELIAGFAATTRLTADQAGARVAVLSLTRNLRILGIFHRLASHLGKPRYRAFLPRTGLLIDRAVAHPALAALRAPVAEVRRQTAGWAR